MTELVCKICFQTGDYKKYTVKEMLQGTRDEFVYFQCDNCGCLQILDVADNLSYYYNTNYYSYKPIKYMELMVRSSWTSYCLKGRNIIGLVTYLLKGKSPLAEIIKNSDIKFDNSVLDVGCGSGIYLHQLKYLGYKNLMGIDPYIEQSSYNTKELSIVKKSIYELDGRVV